MRRGTRCRLPKCAAGSHGANDGAIWCIPQSPVTWKPYMPEHERETLTGHLHASRDRILAVVDGLRPEQQGFRTAEGRGLGANALCEGYGNGKNGCQRKRCTPDRTRDFMGKKAYL